MIDETQLSTYFSSPLIGWCSCKHPSLPLSLSLSLTVTLSDSLFLIGCCVPFFHPSMAPGQWGDRIGFLLDKALPLVVVETMRWVRLLPTHTIIRRRHTLKIQLPKQNLKHLQSDTVSDVKRAQTELGNNRLSVAALHWTLCLAFRPRWNKKCHCKGSRALADEDWWWKPPAT